MQPWLKALNWLALVFFGFAVITLGLMQPSKSVPAVFNLLPFGLALLAVRPGSRHVAAWFAVGFNGLWALLYLLVMVFAGFGLPGGLLVMAAVCIPVATLCVLNIRAVWTRKPLEAG
jgi:hypothetical protein